MRQRSHRRRQDNADTLDAIPALSRGELLARWEASYGTLPHKMISTRLLVLAAGYEAQADSHRGLAKRTAGQLMRLAEASYEPRTGSALSPMSGSQKLAAAQRARPRPGMRYVREWNGKSHMVEVVDTREILECLDSHGSNFRDVLWQLVDGVSGPLIGRNAKRVRALYAQQAGRFPKGGCNLRIGRPHHAVNHPD